MARTSIWGRLLWGALGGGVTAVVLILSGFGLAPPIVGAISAGAAVAVAIVGPSLLELILAAF